MSHREAPSWHQPGSCSDARKPGSRFLRESRSIRRAMSRRSSRTTVPVARTAEKRTSGARRTCSSSPNHTIEMNATARLLSHLGLEREPPTLDYLDRLIEAHQRKVPFETLTKLADYDRGVATGDFLPPLDLYVDRMITRGAGGLCWTLARGFHA